MVNIKIEGIDLTLYKIMKYDEETQSQIKKIILQESIATTKKMKSVAPVGKTGNLKSSTSSKQVKDTSGFARTVVPRRPKGSHRHLVGYGTRKRSTKSGANRGVMPSNSAFANVDKGQESSYQAKIKEIINRHETV